MIHLTISRDYTPSAIYLRVWLNNPPVCQNLLIEEAGRLDLDFRVLRLIQSRRLIQVCRLWVYRLIYSTAGKVKTTAYQPTLDHWETAVHTLSLHIDKFGSGQRMPCPSRRVADIYLKPAGSSYSSLSLKLHLLTQHRCGPDALLGIIHSSRMSERDLLLDSCSHLTH